MVVERIEQGREAQWDLGIVLACVALGAEGFYMRWPASEVGPVLMTISVVVLILHMFVRKWASREILKWEAPIALVAIVLIGILAAAAAYGKLSKPIAENQAIMPSASPQPLLPPCATGGPTIIMQNSLAANNAGVGFESAANACQILQGNYAVNNSGRGFGIAPKNSPTAPPLALKPREQPKKR